jgi:hypothetical protein
MMGLEMAVRDMDRSDEEDSDDETALKGAQKKKRTPRVTSNSGLFLSLFVTFLYQMNQYVVAPTSGLYSDKLGMSAGLSGLIIGLSPLAALVSAMIYSVWTNYSFKQPLVTSLIFLVSGNLFYAIALQCESPRYIFVGRLLTGLGGPRGITRRYIADHVSLADRTEASSYFVTAGAMGLACGPLMSSLVSASRYSFVTRWNDTVIVQYELVTAPGWIMFLLFAVTLIAVLMGFKDPTIAKQKVTHRVGAEKKRHTGHSPWSYLLAPFFYFSSPNPTQSGSSSTGLGGEKVGTGRYGAIPVQEQVVCVELGDILERGDYMDSQTEYSRDSSQDGDSIILKSSFSASASTTPLEPFIELDEPSSEPGTPDRVKDTSSPVSTSPRASAISAAVNLCKTSSPAPYNSLKPRREQSRSGDLGDNMGSSSSLKTNSSIGTSRSTSRKSSVETLDSGKDTLSALDVRTTGKIRATPSNGHMPEEDNQLYEAPAAMSSTGKFSLAGLGGTYTYNYQQRNLVEDDDACWLCCDLFGAEVRDNRNGALPAIFCCLCVHAFGNNLGFMAYLSTHCVRANY